MADGGLAILNEDGVLVHRTPRRIAGALRYFVARTDFPNHLPRRMAVVAALRGEGVTYVSRSLASVIAYDTDRNVALIDLNWRMPGAGAATPKAKRKRRKAATPPTFTVVRGPANSDPAAAARTEPAPVPLSPALELEPEPESNASPATHTAVPGAAGESSKPPARARRGGGAALRIAVPAAPPPPDPLEVDPDDLDTLDVTSTGVESSGEIVPLDDMENTDSRGAPRTLADAVEHGAPIGDILRPTSNPRLTLVDAGELSLARRPAVAASAALETIVAKIVNEFDHVIFDLPPVMASSDAIRLAQLSDAYVLVIQQGRTSTGQIEAALDELRGQASLGVILNRAASRVPRSLRRVLGA